MRYISRSIKVNIYTHDTREPDYQSRHDIDLYDICIVLFSLENKDHGQHSRLLSETLANVLLPFL